MHRGCKLWLMLLHPTRYVLAMEASTCAGAEGSDEGATSAPSHWLKLIDKYLDFFKPPGRPAECDIMQKIELKPGSQPPYRR